MGDFVYMNTFEEGLAHKDDFYSSLTGKELLMKTMIVTICT